MPTGVLDAHDVRRFRDDALGSLRPVGDAVAADAARIDLIAEAEPPTTTPQPELGAVSTR